MAIPKLSEKDQKSLEAVGNLGDDDLYAILGAEPMYYQPTPSPDALLIEFRFEKTKQTIAKGKKRFRQLLEIIRDPICERWNYLKKRRTPLDKNALMALICDVVKRFSGLDPPLPVIPAAILICRACAYSLDVFCKKKTIKRRL